MKVFAFKNISKIAPFHMYISKQHFPIIKVIFTNIFLNVFQVPKEENILNEEKRIFTYQTYWPEKKENSAGATMKYPNVTSLLYYMGNNELFTKVSKSLNKVTSKHSQDIQLYSNIPRDILV